MVLEGISINKVYDGAITKYKFKVRTPSPISLPGVLTW